jgi:hypothetical protein
MITFGLLPGELLVLFFVALDPACSTIAVRASDFLVGLKAADDLLSFSGLCREEPALDELLPWAGSV